MAIFVLFLNPVLCLSPFRGTWLLVVGALFRSKRHWGLFVSCWFRNDVIVERLLNGFCVANVCVCMQNLLSFWFRNFGCISICLFNCLAVGGFVMCMYVCLLVCWLVYGFVYLLVLVLDFFLFVFEIADLVRWKINQTKNNKILLVFTGFFSSIL